MSSILQQDVEYVDVRTGFVHHDPTSFYGKWVDQSSARHATPELIAADALRKLYPGYSLVISDDHRLANLFGLPDVRINLSDEAESGQISNVVFRPTPRRTAGEVDGSLVDDTILGSYQMTWNNTDFVMHITKFQIGNFIKTVRFVLHDGPEQPARDLILAACLHAEQNHNEIWVFNRGFWSKNADLWLEIMNSSWDDIIMKEENKKALQKDIYGFFESEETYKKLSIPWKVRGLIMYGPPGNGKTISIKVIMKTCAERGFIPLYVKSFQSGQGEEGSMQNVFLKARQLAPCVLILEDLDSLINDRNRSFFLNQLDGLEGNDGLLVIASTNHFDRLDPGLSSRPSRFDRKYLFDDPDYQERVLYAKYWQERLSDNDKISFPESLVGEVANLTQGFSFAYLKEAFVSALVQITNADNDEGVVFQVVLKSQIMILRRELGKETPARIVTQIPVAKLEKLSDARISPVKQSPTTSEKDRSRGPKELTLATGVHDDSPLSQTVRTVPQLPVDPTRPRPTEKVQGVKKTSPVKNSPQGFVFHAPPSAYPQVMPGSLPSTSLYTLPHSARRSTSGSSATTSTVNISPSKNPFDNNPPLVRPEDVHTEERSAGN